MPMLSPLGIQKDWYFVIIHPCELKRRETVVPIFPFEETEVLLKEGEKTDF